MAEANQNFSKVIKQNGDTMILKNDKSKHAIKKTENQNKKNEMISVVANIILTEHEKAFKELAK